MQVVPLKALPSQTLQVTLGGQSCVLNIYQLAYGLFMDVYVGATLIIGGVICENLNRIVRSLYLGFTGDFVFFDATGAGADPIYTGLGDRFQLVYLEEADLPAGQG
jgi:uncharacterized protein DUF6983